MSFDEMKYWFQKLCGYSATFLTKEAILPRLIGEDDCNGKTVFQNFMTRHLSSELFTGLPNAQFFLVKEVMSLQNV